MHKKRQSVPIVGGSSLLVIFTVLCLTVFALLSLATAKANARTSETSAQAVLDYYAADSRAEEILARLRAGETPEGVTREGDILRYSCPIGQRQQLLVAVRQTEEGFAVLQWQTLATGEWTPDTSISVWDGA